MIISDVDSHDLPSVTLLKLKHSIDAGDSLKGKTVKDLQTGEYTVEASGAVQNFLKWPLSVQTSEAASGDINFVLPNVKAGIEEGFASHKTSDTATGTWVRYSLVIDADIMFHFIYCAPYNFNFNTNWLSIAMCPKSNTLCRSLNANKMYYNSYPFMKRKRFYYDINPIGICYDDTCVVGWMMKDHHPTMYLLVLPKNYYDLSEKTRKRLPKMTAEDYDWFMKNIIG